MFDSGYVDFKKRVSEIYLKYNIALWTDNGNETLEESHSFRIYENILKDKNPVESLFLFINSINWGLIKEYEYFSENPKDFFLDLYYYRLSFIFPDLGIPHKTLITKELELFFDAFTESLMVVNSIRLDFLNINDRNKKFILPLKKEEAQALDKDNEYNVFIEKYKDVKIFETMQIYEEMSGHLILDHVIGVNYLALSIARQIKYTTLDIDLGVVMAISTGHDIGKLACVGDEEVLAPYLHYYYTDFWFSKNGMPKLGSLASNHSTWDLELENLSIENLLLIYSDFRVKTINSDNGEKKMEIISLEVAYQNIMDKLDNIDDIKKRRYERVYKKIKDFEDYLISIGIDINLRTFGYIDIVQKKRPELLQGEELVAFFKNMAIDHNVRMMYFFRNETTLKSFIEVLSNEQDPSRMRENIHLLKEFHKYLSRKQKLMVVDFLLTRFTSPEDDIRRNSAEIAVHVLLSINEKYKKNIPENRRQINSELDVSSNIKDIVAGLFSITPTVPLAAIEWQMESGEVFLTTMLENSSGDFYRNLAIEIILDLIKENNKKDGDIISVPDDENYRKYAFLKMRIVLLIKKFFCDITYEYIKIDKNSWILIVDFLSNASFSKEIWLRLAAIDTIGKLFALDFISFEKLVKIGFGYYLKDTLLEEKQLIIKEIENLADSDDLQVSEKYVLASIRNLVSDEGDVSELSILKKDPMALQHVFLANLKTETHWYIKKIHLEMLEIYGKSWGGENLFYLALHLCNILKVSEVESIRRTAGQTLLTLVKGLKKEEINDISIELVRALEINEFKFVFNIPYFLSNIFVLLEEKEANELLEDLSDKIRRKTQGVTMLHIQTAALSLGFLLEKNEKKNLSDILCDNRVEKLLRILVSSIYDSNINIRMAGFHNLGLSIFDNKNIRDEIKHEILAKIIKKLSILLFNKRENNFVLLQNSVAYNYVYRFINYYESLKGSIDIAKSEKIAFFFGAFSPLSLAHKEVAIKVRDCGCEVMLMLDEFMWNRSLLPGKIRGEIATLSVSDQLEINVYPLEFPVNRGNDEDIRRLNESFPGIEKWVVVAEEAILKDDFYTTENYSTELFKMNHFIFERLTSNDKKKDLQKKIGQIKGEVIKLKIDNEKMRFSSKAISNLIRNKGDLSQVIDSAAEKYISSFGFNDDGNRYKEAFEDVSMDVDVHVEFKSSLINEIKSVFFQNDSIIEEYLENHYKKPEAGVLTIRKTVTGELLGFSIFSRLKNDMVYDHFRDRDISSFVYDNSTGSILLINGMFYLKKEKSRLERHLLTETLANALAQDYEYCLYHDNVQRRDMSEISETLMLYGFIKLRINGTEFPVFHVSMKNVSTLYLDSKPLIKGVYGEMQTVTDVISLNRERIQTALTRLSPGQLLLSFDRKMLYASLIKKICKENDVSFIRNEDAINKKNKYGEAVCAPFGNMLFKQLVPNCITISLHTEKIFHSDLIGFRIGASPFYLDLETQIKVLASMGKPVILVDDLLDKGYRLNALNPLLWKHKVNVKKIIVGILSNKGKELMDIQGHKVDGAYIVPKLKSWFNESMLIPFLGGDSIEKQKLTLDNRKLIPGATEDQNELSNLIPSINMLLPYAKPTFIKDSGHGKIEELSKVCLEGAIEIFSTLEEIYEDLNGKGLYIEKLGDVLMIPRIPDIGVAASYKKGMRVSEALESELERLIRTSGKF